MLAAIALAAVLSAAPSGPAQAAPPVAVELSRLMLPRGNWDQLVQAQDAQVQQVVAQTMVNAVKRDGIEPPEGLEAFVRDEMKGTLGRLMPSYEEMVDFQAGVLQKYYAEGELRELLRFYRSALGEKTIRIQPEIGRDVMGWSQARIQQRLPEVMEDLMVRTRTFFESQRARSVAPAAK